MGCRLYLNFKTLVCILTVSFVIVFKTSGQTVLANLELEVTTTKKYGKVLIMKTTIRNQVGRKIFLDNFLKAMEIEKLNSKNDQYENYFDQWFANTFNDSQRPQICAQLGIKSPSHDGALDSLFARELSNFNTNILDSVRLKQWVNYISDRIEVLEENGKIEFHTYLNSLPIGTYRLRFRYSNLVGSSTPYPMEKFKNVQIPNSLLNYLRWLGEIDSNYMYLSIK